MSAINPLTVAAASYGLQKLGQAVQPFADFALGAFAGPDDSTASVTPQLGGREELSQDAQQSLLDLVGQLEAALAQLGISLDEPVELQQSATGRVIVSNPHEARDKIEDLFESPQLRALFQEAAARFQALSAFPNTQLPQEAPRQFQLRYGTGEVNAGFVA
jgi:hypothetical protein